jgi:kynurenine formamidase
MDTRRIYTASCLLGAALLLLPAARAQDAAATPAASQPAQGALDLSRYDIVDLTHSFDASTLYWPTSPTGFEWKHTFAGKTPAGFYYEAAAFCTPEHLGTHLDAPVHFAEGQLAADQVPLSSLIAPAVVVDVSARTGADRDYRATVADVEAFEQAHGPIPAGSIVLLHTGWGKHWPDRKAVFGDDKPGDATNLHFPGYSAEAARLLVEQRKVAALGIDTPSIDAGQAQDFIVHQISAARGVAGLENVANLDRLPPTGATLFALPMKIARGTGGPVRIVALVPKR